MKQFTGRPNIGDVIGAPIVQMVTGRETQIVGETPLPFPNLIGVGSILHWSDEHSILWGCGLIAPDLCYESPAEVLAVRGRLTRDDLVARGVRCPDILGDIGLLLPDLIAASEPIHSLGLIPHYVDADSEFVQACRRDEVLVIDVAEPPEVFVKQLTSCRRIVSSSLHGIVIAHAYGIEAIWVKISEGVHGGGFKFLDYYTSLGLTPADVLMMSPRYHTIGQMADACWCPDALPDRALLRQVLKQRVAVLDQ